MPLRSVVGAGNPAKQHFLNRILVHLQLGGDLPIGKVQSHKVLFGLSTNKQAKHPDGKRLMMPGKHGSGQVVERPVAHPAKVVLTIRLRFVVSVFGDLRRMTAWTLNAFRPAKLPHHLVTFRVVDQSLNVDSHPT